MVDDVSVIKSDAVADAGPNRVIPVGSPDSVWIGDSSGYLPTCWYVNGVMIDSNTAGFKVHPDTTTRYVMSLDVCGHITYDTVIVWRGVNTVGTASTGAVNIYPSPAVDALTVEHAAGSTLELYDVVGRLALSSRIMTDRETLSIFHLLPGVYTALIRMQSGKRVFMKVVK
ncbi:MAG: T9SS type A sorting domain-containing protein [Bacteroidota bacterium]